MATNNIKIFDQNKANMLTDEAYNTSTQRLNGVQQGIASSQLQNKTLYQVSLVAYAIGQMMQNNGLNANDADAVSTFANNLSASIVQKIVDKADATEAKNFTVNNKFITPQTWKAAYDFMKADSNMVTSAVDDTHYITPKLLKEGANLFGGKVELEDGTITKWRTFNKMLINSCSIAIQNDGTVQVIMLTKQKKYFVVKADTNIYQPAIFLIDANTGEIKSSINTNFNYDYKNFTIQRDSYISSLSDNSFLFTAKEENGGGISVFAVDFATGNLYIRKRYALGNNAEFNVNIIDHTTYFKHDLYLAVNSLNSNFLVIHYHELADKFDAITYTTDADDISSIALNDGRFLVLFFANDSASLSILEYSGTTVTPHVGSLDDCYRAGIAWEVRNNFLYVVYHNDGNYGVLNKINLQSFVWNTLQKTYSFPVNAWGLILVNNEETAFYWDGVKYGDGEMQLSFNYSVPYAINYYDNTLFNTQSVQMYGYEGKLITKDPHYALNLVYAYFGAPITDVE